MLIGTVQLHLLVSGRVQGVGYRAATQQRARSLGLHGWVRNLSDGRVEIVAEGEAQAVEQLMAWCKTGPPLAVVSNVHVERRAAEGLQGFELLR